MTISLEPARGVTNAAVAADFEGQYSLTEPLLPRPYGGSRGVLEKAPLTTNDLLANVWTDDTTAALGEAAPRSAS
jgi:hypothetical protein